MQTGNFHFRMVRVCVWCMWLSDSGSGFGKIVKCQTDLQKKCQMELHNDKNGARKSSIYTGSRALAMWFEYRLSTKLLRSMSDVLFKNSVEFQYILQFHRL